jgi:phytoene dehydrogenase-like protein
MAETADAVVVGAGPNGLVCANMLADAGWDVLVLEAAPTPGGGVSSADYLGAGFVADVCSAFYPLAAASPVLGDMHLEDHGLEWCHSPAVFAHPLPGGESVACYRDLERTVASVERHGTGDGASWRRLFALWEQTGPSIIKALFSPFPPVRGGAGLVSALGVAGLLRFLRFALLPVRRLAEEDFAGPGGAMLLAGCAMHTDLSPESAASATFGWLLAMLAQEVGFPVPKGGAGQLTAALVRRLESKGGRVVCGQRVAQVSLAGSRARGVVTSAGDTYRARRAVMADVDAPTLYGELVGWGNLPAGLGDDMRRFQWDYSTVKLDWALDGPIPWRSPEVAEAGTVHISDSMDEMTAYCADIARGRVPARPYILLGQMVAADPSRAPAGAEVGWAYTHVPRQVRGDAGGDGITGDWDDRQRQAIVARMEERIEEHAPGFKSLVRSRHLACPSDLHDHDANLVGGALNGGTTAVHQQLVFRPHPGLGRPETPVSRLYLASSSAHPGGGVHGACGANAARAALSAETGAGRLLVRPLRAAAGRVARGY